MMLPVIFFNKPDAFCNLPIALANRYKDNTLLVLKLQWGKDDTEPCFASWLGGISNTDAIELPCSQFESYSSHDIVTICAILNHVPEAEEVHYTPQSRYDWDILSTQAETVENKLLALLSIAYKEQVIRVQISSSLSVQLKCTGVKINGEKSEEIETIDSTTNETKESSIDIVRMSAGTLAIIAPYKEDFSNDDINSNENKNRGLIDITAINQAQRPNIDSVSALQRVIEGSAAYPLRVLPRSFHTQDTSYRTKDSENNTASMILSDQIDKRICLDTKDTKQEVCINGRLHSTDNSMHTDLETDKNQDRYSNALESNEELLNEMLSDTSWFDTEDDCTDRKYKENDRNVTDEYSCLVHPLFFQCAYESSMNIYQGLKQEKNTTAMNSKIGNDLNVQKERDFDMDVFYIGTLRLDNYKTETEGSTKPVADSMVVRVKLSKSVRPFNISLPNSVRKSLGIGDYAHVRLQITGSTCLKGGEQFLQAPILPYEIMLESIHWMSVPGQGLGEGSGDDGRGFNDANDCFDSRNSVTGDGDSVLWQSDIVKEAFLRYFEVNCTSYHGAHATTELMPL